MSVRRGALRGPSEAYFVAYAATSGRGGQRSITAFIAFVLVGILGCEPQLDYFEKSPSPTVDNQAPLVVSISPTDEAERVVLDAPLEIAFSEPMDPLSLSYPTIHVWVADESVEGSWTSGEDFTEIRFQPYFQWEPETIYTIEIDSEIRDLSGNRMGDEDLVFQFTTGSTFASDPIEIVSVTPPEGSIGVETSAVVSVQFSKSLDPNSEGLQAIEWMDSSGPIRFSSRLSRSSSLLTLVPLQPLAMGMEYTIGIPSGIVDRYGQSMTEGGAPPTGELGFHFTTVHPAGSCVELCGQEKETDETGEAGEDPGVEEGEAEPEASDIEESSPDGEETSDEQEIDSEEDACAEPCGEGNPDSEPEPEPESEPELEPQPELAGYVVINEMVVDPQQDWGDSSGGDGVSFNNTPGTGSITGSDEWIELFNASLEPVDLTGWSIHMLDGTDEVDILGEGSGTERFSGVGSSIAHFESQSYLVIGNPTGDNLNKITIELRNNLGELVDTVRVGVEGGLPQDGDASSVEDEAIARRIDGVDTDSEAADFVRQRATPGFPNGDLL
ncbi:MAG: Ig-like domain-containing protein [Deltaproteobacteria bacterium]|nr:Ig-like domain-containing protein [Deltaproteobacteria bacterium]